jgi:hypothetical protein
MDQIISTAGSLPGPAKSGLPSRRPDIALDNTRDYQDYVEACPMRNHNGRILIGQLLESLN